MKSHLCSEISCQPRVIQRTDEIINHKPAAFCMHNNRPIKRFGQNYLVDKNIIDNIVKEIDPQKDDLILEIGPGRGALTRELIKHTDSLYAVEIDKRVIESLQFEMPLLNMINADILKFDLKKIAEGKNKKIRVAGNIPYNITSPILFKLIAERDIVKDTVLMMQYEVAKRLTAEKRTKDYGILAVLLNYYAKVKFCFKVSRNVFYPKPNVESAVVHINFDFELENSVNNKLFIQTVKASFGNRRKTLKNSLSNSIFKDIDFSGAKIDLSRRAEELDIEEFIELTNFIEKAM